jgi:carbonic anhydrase/acetyltransferase-like protein (isoleucine patch superfamily)
MLTQGKAYPPGVLILGAPGKIVRELTSEEIEFNRLSAETYVQRSQAFKMGYTGRA